MAYTTPEAVRERLSGGGSDPSGSTAAAMADEELQKACDDAIAEIDGRAPGDPYDDPAPALIQRIATDVASYLATLTHRKANALDPDNPVRLRHDQAQKLLDGIADGTVEVEAPDGGADVGGDVAIANMYEGDLFTLPDFGLGLAATRRDLG